MQCYNTDRVFFFRKSGFYGWLLQAMRKSLDVGFENEQSVTVYFTSCIIVKTCVILYHYNCLSYLPLYVPFKNVISTA